MSLLLFFSSSAPSGRTITKYFYHPHNGAVLHGITVELYDTADGSEVSTKTTDEFGLVQFTGLDDAKRYRITALIPDDILTIDERDSLSGVYGTPISHTALNDVGTNTHAQIDTHIIATTHTPTGVVHQYAGSAAPSGYLLCDGAAVSRTTYAALFAVVSTTYGVGDGATTFNLPNLKGKIPVGLNSAEIEFDALGETGGAKTHQLTAAEMPAHTHTQNSHNHTQDAHTHTQNSHNHTQDSHQHSISLPPHDHTQLNFDIPGGTNANWLTSGGTWRWGTATVATGLTADSGSTTGTVATNQNATATNQNATATNQATTATNQNTGSNTAHQNLQPYLVLNYIIKT